MSWDWAIMIWPSKFWSRNRISYLGREILYFYPNATNTLNGVFSSFWVEIKRKISDPIEFLQFHGALTCSIYTRIPLELVCFVSMHILDRKCYTDFMEDFLKIHSFWLPWWGLKKHLSFLSGRRYTRGITKTQFLYLLFSHESPCMYELFID